MLECLDDEHAAAATRARVREFGVLGVTVIAGLVLFRRHVEQAACMGDVVGARAAGEQAIVADAVEARRQDVDQESADELGGSECHDLLTIATIGTIVLPSEGDASVVEGDQPTVGDGDTVGIARQIGQHGLWPAERTFGIDDPFGSAQRCQNLRGLRRRQLSLNEARPPCPKVDPKGIQLAFDPRKVCAHIYRRDDISA